MSFTPSLAKKRVTPANSGIPEPPVFTGGKDGSKRHYHCSGTVLRQITETASATERGTMTATLRIRRRSACLCRKALIEEKAADRGYRHCGITRFERLKKNGARLSPVDDQQPQPQSLLPQELPHPQPPQLPQPKKKNDEDENYPDAAVVIVAEHIYCLSPRMFPRVRSGAADLRHR